MNDPKTDRFVLDLETIRKSARTHLDQGAVTKGYRLDVEQIVGLLDASLATELVCVLRYKRHYFMSAAVGGIPGFAFAEELLVHANEEQAHADRLAERIVQLGGEPTFDPASIARRTHAPYAAGSDLGSMLEEDLVAERIAIDSYRSIVGFLGEKDPTTRRLLEDILAQEEEHADDLADVLRKLASGREPRSSP